MGLLRKLGETCLFFTEIIFFITDVLAAGSLALAAAAIRRFASAFSDLYFHFDGRRSGVRVIRFAAHVIVVVCVLLRLMLLVTVFFRFVGFLLNAPAVSGEHRLKNDRILVDERRLLIVHLSVLTQEHEISLQLVNILQQDKTLK